MGKGLYPIRAAARLTRLTADTLRAWERRYGAVSPARKNGIRLYTEVDVERLSMLREALDRGHSIGHAAGLSSDELRKLVSSSPGSAAATQPARARKNHDRDPLTAIVAAVESFSYAAADQELGKMAWLMSPRDVVYQVALPLMRLAGQRWHDQRMRVAQEHLLTQLLSNLLGGMLRLYTRSNPPATVLTTTIAGDLHGFGILAAAMLASSAGLGVIHLGPNLPAEEVSYAARRSGSSVVLMSLTGEENLAEGSSQLASVRARLPAETELWVALNPPELVAKIKMMKKRRVKLIVDFVELERELKRVGGSA
jgi:DNA-binding transcriptional MerR regulator/methylmalonyl-CoA mutase cobalamin-binding subunit